MLMFEGSNSELKAKSHASFSVKLGFIFCYCVRSKLKWSCFLGQFCGLAKMHQVGFHAAVRISAWLKYAASGVRLSSAV